MISLNNLFAKLGRCVYWCNFWVNAQWTYILAPSTGQADDVQNQFNDRRDLVTGFESTMLAQANSLATMVGNQKQIADATLSSLQQALNAPNSRPTTILPLLAAYMTANSAT